ncbi:single-stranded DNA-binding protein [Grimontia sp. SpTr1]|uniref:single-stranded DNA-binding protein n=1 Tax=Grimontia sp. SpTr1 TaxID=2995319 RepID=UPI00248CD8A5|nr:single-stranded DNA-binding protein [Grimontia sp. SpTr1]
MLTVLCLLGADAVLRTTPNGHNVASLSLAYSIGYGANKETQWLNGQLWGDRAVKLAPHLTKGKQLLIHAEDVAVDTYQKGDGTTAASLKAKIMNVEFTDSAKTETAPAQAQPAAPIETDWRDIKPPF